jgi:hypothetical protein
MTLRLERQQRVNATVALTTSPLPRTARLWLTISLLALPPALTAAVPSGPGAGRGVAASVHAGVAIVPRCDGIVRNVPVRRPAAFAKDVIGRSQTGAFGVPSTAHARAVRRRDSADVGRLSWPNSPATVGAGRRRSSDGLSGWSPNARRGLRRVTVSGADYRCGVLGRRDTAVACAAIGHTLRTRVPLSSGLPGTDVIPTLPYDAPITAARAFGQRPSKSSTRPSCSPETAGGVNSVASRRRSGCSTRVHLADRRSITSIHSPAAASIPIGTSSAPVGNAIARSGQRPEANCDSSKVRRTRWVS